MGVTALTGDPPQPSGPRPRLVYMPALTLAGLFARHEQGSDDDRTRQGISEQWGRFGVQLAECFASQRANGSPNRFRSWWIAVWANNASDMWP